MLLIAISAIAFRTNGESSLLRQFVHKTPRTARIKQTCLSLSTLRENVGKPKGVLPKTAINSKFRPPDLRPSDPPIAASGLPDRTRPFTVLGIETSCDDTGAAVVRSDGVILGEALASQAEIHEEWGGVVPSLAMKAHEKEIDRMVGMALKNAGMTSVDEVDAIGVTVGPGLEICLRVGCETAKDLAKTYSKPFVAIHHLEAHCLMARFSCGLDTLKFPFLALLTSGGHLQLLLVEGVGQFSVIGGTLDDAFGEAYDKVARMLVLSVGGGGGPAIEKLAKDGCGEAIPLPVPMASKPGCDFSFSGLKNAFRMAVSRSVEENQVASAEDLPRQVKADLAASFQNVGIKHIEQRLKRAMSLCEQKGVHQLVLVGGVAANAELRQRLQSLCEKVNSKMYPPQSRSPWEMLVPEPRLCTDNGVMVAWAAIERISLGVSDFPDEHGVYPRWPLGQLIVKEKA